MRRCSAASWRAGFVALMLCSVAAWLLMAWKVHEPPQPGAAAHAPLSMWQALLSYGALFRLPHTLGILLLEQFTALQKTCPVQIFATDVDEEALEAAGFEE